MLSLSIPAYPKLPRAFASGAFFYAAVGTGCKRSMFKMASTSLLLKGIISSAQPDGKSRARTVVTNTASPRSRLSLP